MNFVFLFDLRDDTTCNYDAGGIGGTWLHDSFQNDNQFPGVCTLPTPGYLFSHRCEDENGKQNPLRFSSQIDVSYCK